MNTTDIERTETLAEMARYWPTIKELSDKYQVNHRLIYKAIDAGQVLSFKLNVTRVEPVSFLAWLRSRQK